MTTRKPLRRPSAQGGLSLVDANQGRLITYGPDVLDIKREIESRWEGLISCWFDQETERWVITQHSPDGTESLFFTTEALSQQTIDRIHRADHNSRSWEDPDVVMTREEEERDKELDRRFSERIGDIGERLYHGLIKDGLIHRPRVFFANREGS